MYRSITALSALCAGIQLAITAAPAISADAYPSKPIRMLVGFAPGGSADINARHVAQQLGKELGGASVIVENKAGAGGNLAASEVKRSAPDGYTVFYGTSAVVLAPALYAKPGFDPYNDFIPISLTATIPLVLVVNPGLPVKTVNDLVSHAKATPGAVNYGSSGSGALLHLAGALFTREMGIEASHVPYKGSAPATTDLLGGQIQFMFLPINEALSHLKRGTLRPLAVTHEKRSPLLPDVPTIREATGKTSMDMGAWQGLMVPRGTPGDIVQKLDTALQKTLKDPALSERLNAQGSIVLGGTHKQYADFMKAEGDRWARVVRETGAKVE